MLARLLDSFQHIFRRWRQRHDALALWDRVNPIERGAIPDSLNPLDPLHFQFAAAVASDFGDVLQSEVSPWGRCMFRPEIELPYPRDLIRRSLQYLATTTQTPPELLEAVRASAIHLENFVPAGRVLPTDPSANLVFAKSRGWL